MSKEKQRSSTEWNNMKIINGESINGMVDQNMVMDIYLAGGRF